MHAAFSHGAVASSPTPTAAHPSQLFVAARTEERGGDSFPFFNPTTGEWKSE